MTSGKGSRASDSIGFGPAKADDLAALVSIERGSARPWSAESFTEEMAHAPPTLFVHRRSERATAYAVVRVQGLEMDIVNLAVDPDLRRQGLGRALLRALLDQAGESGIESVFLEVREGNRAARGLYLDAGFKPSQRRRGFYREPVEDAILMRLEMRHERG